MKLDPNKLSKLKEFDIADYIDTKEDAIGYLEAALDAGNVSRFIDALQDIAKSKGMTELAKDTGLNRESLYKTLRRNSHPRFETIIKILHGLGLHLRLSH